MNPYVSVQGGTAIGIQSATHIDRKCQSEFTMSSGALTVKAGDLLGVVPDGAKILGMKVYNINGRKIAVTIPNDSVLITTTGNPLTAPTVQIQKVAYAPLSVFPRLKIEIPDLIATPLDTNTTSTQVLFKLVTDGATDKVVVRFHYKQAF